MKLVTFGCSFIEGDELLPNTFIYKNTHNIGGVINSNYKFDEYVNFGNNGASNERIILQILEYINSEYYDSDDFILVGLSGLNRSLKYLNKHKFAFTIPNWSYDDHIKNTNHFLSKDDDFEAYMKSVLKYEVNNRNEITQYFLNCMTIKSLLSNFKKYLIFQSIDSSLTLYKKIKNDIGWKEINMLYSTTNSNYEIQSNLFFNKDFTEKIIKSNLEENQIWLNFSKTTYKSFLESNDRYAAKGGHPTELGAKMFFEKVLKKYIDKILDI